MAGAGQIVILNGAPRSGKSSIVRAMQATFEGPWINLGVDTYMEATPERYRPGIGLRPGGERPDLEPVVRRLFEALFASVAAHARVGLDVVVDVGIHDGHSAPIAIWPYVASQLTGLPAWLVGVRCPIEVIMARRDVVDPARRARYLTSDAEDQIPGPVRRWQEAVHVPGIYDVEVDTSTMTPEACAASIGEHLAAGSRPHALEHHASLTPPDGP